MTPKEKAIEAYEKGEVELYGMIDVALQEQAKQYLNMKVQQQRRTKETADRSV